VQSTIIDVGAPLRNWIFRVALTLLVAAVAAFLLTTPGPIWLRVGVLALLAVA
jgi:hypothetical protein